MEVVEIEKNSKKRVYKKGDILFFAGDMPTKLLFLTKGEIEIFKHDSNGDEIIMGTFAPFSLIAEMPTLNNVPYPATARCIEDSMVYEMEISDEILSILQFRLFRFFIDSMTKKIEKLENIISYLTISDAKSRVAKYIYDNMSTLNNTTQRQIASNLRLTPEGLSRILKKFKEEEIIATKSKKIVILDLERLKKFF